jgi:hypothetical protein
MTSSIQSNIRMDEFIQDILDDHITSLLDPQPNTSQGDRAMCMFNGNIFLEEPQSWW